MPSFIKVFCSHFLCLKYKLSTNKRFKEIVTHSRNTTWMNYVVIDFGKSVISIVKHIEQNPEFTFIEIYYPITRNSTVYSHPLITTHNLTIKLAMYYKAILYCRVKSCCCWLVLLTRCCEGYYLITLRKKIR